MKTLKEQLNESMQINESFLSFGLTVIVALKLAALALGGIAGLATIWFAIANSIKKDKKLKSFIKELDGLLTPYRDELLNTEYGSKLFGEDQTITLRSLRSLEEKPFSVVYLDLQEDLKSVLSSEDYQEYKRIINRINSYNPFL